LHLASSLGDDFAGFLASLNLCKILHKFHISPLALAITNPQNFADCAARRGQAFTCPF